MASMYVSLLTCYQDDMLQAESELIDGSKKKYSEEELAELRALLKQSQKAKRFKVRDFVT